MSKGLTENWKKGKIKGGYYYLLMNDGSIRVSKTIYLVGEIRFWWDNASIDFVKEVLEPVPSYEEYQDIIQQNVNQEAAIETYIEDIKRLQEQLSEANEIIKYYAEKHGKLKACDYLNKWGVK